MTSGEQISLISCKVSAITSLNFSVDVNGLLNLDSMPNFIISGAARSE
jgi:hypothetical protein